MSELGLVREITRPAQVERCVATIDEKPVVSETGGCERMGEG